MTRDSWLSSSRYFPALALAGALSLGPACAGTEESFDTAPSPSDVTGQVEGSLSCGGLANTEQLTPNQSVRSCNSFANLVHQTDGNVVLYDDVGVLWATYTNGRATSRFTMQNDGNLVLYSSTGSPLWASNTSGNFGARLAVQDDCNMVIYGTGGQVLWATYTQCRVDVLRYMCPSCVGEGATRNTMSNGECFNTVSRTVAGKSGFRIAKSCNQPGIHEDLNYDGSFIYHLSDTSWADSSGHAIFCSNGQQAYSTYLNGSGVEGGQWVPRYMSIGQDSGWLGFSVAAKSLSSCGTCTAPYTGSTGHSVKLVSRQTVNFGGNVGARDTIRLAITNGAGRGENYWYAKGLGWVAYANLVNRGLNPDSPFDVMNADARISNYDSQTISTSGCGN